MKNAAIFLLAIAVAALGKKPSERTTRVPELALILGEQTVALWGRDLAPGPLSMRDIINN